MTKSKSKKLIRLFSLQAEICQQLEVAMVCKRDFMYEYYNEKLPIYFHQYNRTNRLIKRVLTYQSKSHEYSNV